MNLFFQLIQVALGHRSRFTLNPTADEWRELLATAVRQSLVGVCGSGIERLPAEQRPPHDISMRWAFMVSKIEQRNTWLDSKCGEITDLLAFDGFSSCILKGQGVARLYPEPLRRQSGDIDILCRPFGSTSPSDSMAEVVKYVRNQSGAGKVVYHHAELDVAFGRSADGHVCYVPVSDGNSIDIEMHYRPSWFFSPLRNRRFQKWAWRMSSETRLVDDGRFYVPSLQFNAVYILVHIYRHLFDEGIGLRQLLDYYYVIDAFSRSGLSKADLLMTFRRLGLYRFAGAVMYVLQEVFGMRDDCMPVPADEREGRFLLSEIMQAGNFGKFDERSKPHVGESLSRRFVRRQRRVARFLWHYPEEVVCAPFWTLWQWMWRKYNGYM